MSSITKTMMMVNLTRASRRRSLVSTTMPISILAVLLLASSFATTTVRASSSSSEIKFVKKTVSSHSIVIFSKSYCPTNNIKPVGAALVSSSPHKSLHAGNWVKLICGASFEDVADIRNLSLIYTLAGVDCIDCAAEASTKDYCSKIREERRWIDDKGLV